MRGKSGQLSVGMVGVGGYGGFRRSLMRKTGLFRVLACFDRSAAATRAACNEEGAQPCASFGELLATPGIEAVVISTGASSHADYAAAAMDAGLHVFVEKPLCCSPDEIERLQAAQRRNRVVLGVGHKQNEADPVAQLVRQFLAEKRLGDLAAYEENTSHSGGLQIRKGDWRGDPAANPGGMLFQCGVHALHRLQYLFGPVQQVQAMMRFDVHSDSRTADTACVLLRHRSGLVGTLNCYHVTGYCHELRLFGTGGNLYIDTFEQRAWFQKALYGPREPRVEVELPQTPGSDAAALASWYDAIREGGAPSPGIDDGIAALAPVFAADRAAREGRAVEVHTSVAVPRTPRTVAQPAMRSCAPGV
jgi:UDP-N-acetyl-2-amino-2-deoxyglucuronate dehydrogenase